MSDYLCEYTGCNREATWSLNIWLKNGSYGGAGFACSAHIGEVLQALWNGEVDYIKVERL